MNKTTERLLAKLEQATARETADAEMSPPLDDEAAELRESWLALRKLLEAADAGSGQEVRSQKLEVKSQKSGSGVALGFLAALAASLLVALAAWKATDLGTNSINPTPEVAVPRMPAPARAIAEVAELPAAGDSADVVDGFAWEDSFDEQLAAADQAIRSAQADWSGGDRRYAVLLDQFEQFDEELSEGSL